MSRALDDVAAERRRQIEVEGWGHDHDDALHDNGALARAAACYALGRSISIKGSVARRIPDFELWPWDWKWWKPKDRRRDLVRAGALILAEIERLDRVPEQEGASETLGEPKASEHTFPNAREAALEPLKDAKWLLEAAAFIEEAPDGDKAKLARIRAALAALLSPQGGEREKALEEALQMFVDHYPHGVNPYLDEAYGKAKDALRISTASGEG
jgi:hypothetical protein